MNRLPCIAQRCTALLLPCAVPRPRGRSIRSKLLRRPSAFLLEHTTGARMTTTAWELLRLQLRLLTTTTTALSTNTSASIGIGIGIGISIGIHYGCQC